MIRLRGHHFTLTRSRWLPNAARQVYYGGRAHKTNFPQNRSPSIINFSEHVLRRGFSSTPVTRATEGEHKGPSLKEDPVGWFKTLPSLIWDGLVYTWIGFKLFGLNIRTAFGLVFRLVRGYPLTRREHRLLVTTAADIFRMVPFSFFVIVPMAEFLLPVALKLFPNMLPSTFTTQAQNEAKMQRKLKARIKMAYFVKETAMHLRETSEKFAIKFDEFMEGIKSGQEVSRDEVYKFVSKFKDDLTLDNLKRSQIQAMCRFLDIVPYGPTQLLRYQIRNRVNGLKADDKMIREEGLRSLTLVELKQACAARGMSSTGTRATLEYLMEEWLDLSLNLKVPTALLILSRAFRLMPHQTTEELILESIQHMPETVIDEVETEVGLSSLNPNDLKGKYEILKEELQKVYKENKEKRKGKQDTSKELVGSVEELRPEDQKVSEVGDYIAELVAPCEGEKQDILTIEQEIAQLPKEIPMVKKLELMVQSLEEQVRKAEAESKRLLDLDSDGLLTCDELTHILGLAGLKSEEIKDLIVKLDRDGDGFVDLEHVTELRKLDINIDSLKAAQTVTDVDAKKRAELYKKVKQFQKQTGGQQKGPEEEISKKGVPSQKGQEDEISKKGVESQKAQEDEISKKGVESQKGQEDEISKKGVESQKELEDEISKKGVESQKGLEDEISKKGVQSQKGLEDEISKKGQEDEISKKGVQSQKGLEDEISKKGMQSPTEPGLQNFQVSNSPQEIKKDS